MKAKIHVTLKQGILDPQGKAIEHALDSLGFKNAGNVRVGKYMEVDVNETDKAKAEAQVKQMCEKLLQKRRAREVVEGEANGARAGRRQVTWPAAKPSGQSARRRAV